MNQRLQELVRNYQMPKKAIEILTQSKPLLIASVTGGGKNTIIDELLKTNQFHYIVSHTTRQPRENHGVLEKNGINYWFISEDELITELEQQKFIEAKIVHEQNVYGTSIFEFERAIQYRKKPLIEIDVQGVEEMKLKAPDVLAVFLIPPSFEVWMQRLDKRNNFSKAELQTRMQTAKQEIVAALDGDFVMVVNDDLEATVECVSHLSRHQLMDDSPARRLAQELVESL
jgi:guanylate kinase